MEWSGMKMREVGGKVGGVGGSVMHISMIPLS